MEEPYTRLEAIDAEVDYLRHLYAEGGIDDDTLSLRLKALAEERAALVPDADDAPQAEAIAPYELSFREFARVAVRALAIFGEEARALKGG